MLYGNVGPTCVLVGTCHEIENVSDCDTVTSVFLQVTLSYSREVRLNLSFVAKNYLYFFPERCDHKK